MDGQARQQEGQKGYQGSHRIRSVLKFLSSERILQRYLYTANLLFFEKNTRLVDLKIMKIMNYDTPPLQNDRQDATETIIDIKIYCLTLLLTLQQKTLTNEYAERVAGHQIIPTISVRPHHQEAAILNLIFSNPTHCLTRRTMSAIFCSVGKTARTLSDISRTHGWNACDGI